MDDSQTISSEFNEVACEMPTKVNYHQINFRLSIVIHLHIFFDRAKFYEV